MKLLFDQNISFRVIKGLHSLYSEAKQVKELGLENASDKQIWKYAKENNYTIVTFDGDFYEMSSLYGHPPKIIWLRFGNTSTQNLIKVFEQHLETITYFISDSNYTEIGCLEIDK